MRTNIQYFNIILLFFCFAGNVSAESQKPIITIGSKKFTENIILGEIAASLADYYEYEGVHKKELGGTRIMWNALLKGEIDIYPEYTGTILKEILSASSAAQEKNLAGLLAEFNIEIGPALGFNNTYAVGMKKAFAKKLNINKISDLQNHSDLYFGFTNEFMDRNDGWPGLKAKYNLAPQNVTGLDHDLAYRGLESDEVQVIDLYSTDAEIKYYDLAVLEDDLNYFTNYHSVFLYRRDLNEKAPKFVKALSELKGKIPADEMIKMNSRAKLDKINEGVIAAEFLNELFGFSIENRRISIWERLLHNTKEHLYLVSISLFMAVILAVPLGIIAVKSSRFENIILGVTGIIQTIPSLALLVFMIPLMGIGGPPAIAALFLYSLLPIVRNTHSGIKDIPAPVMESAQALGLSAFAQLRLIELPMASRSILAGIKTSAVINVGTAALGALIGAGGYGQPILTGIRLDDTGLILQGAVPAAVLALLVQWLFDLSEYIFVPKGLRLELTSNN